MSRYNKIFAGPSHKNLPQVKEAPAAASILPGVIAVITANEFVAAAATAVGRLYVVQDNYLVGKKVNDAYGEGETTIGIELMDEFYLNVRVPTGVNVALDAPLTIGAGGKIALAAVGSRIVGYADEAYNNTSGEDQLVRMRPADTRMAPAA